MNRFLYPLFFLSLCYLCVQCAISMKCEIIEIPLPENYDGEYDHFQILKSHMRKQGWHTIFIAYNLIIEGKTFGRKEYGPIYCSLEPVKDNNRIRVEELDFFTQTVLSGETTEQIKKRLIVRSMFYSTLPILIDRVIVNGERIGSFELR